VVVRPTVRHGPGGAHPLFAGHIVVGVDGSPSSRAALEFAFGYAAEHRRPVAAVHVEPKMEAVVSFDDSARELQLGAAPAALAFLAEEVEPWQHKYPDVAVKRAVFGGRALAGLLRAATGSELLCLGSSGSGWAGRLPGSVTHDAIDRAPCPVAIIHADLNLDRRVDGSDSGSDSGSDDGAGRGAGPSRGERP
jgi:nucleotide-binding universal stress UspA family protein